MDFSSLCGIYNGQYIVIGPFFFVITNTPSTSGYKVDKLFNPLTLLVGPTLVSYLMYKSTIPVEQGGYHLPWWYASCSLFLWPLSFRFCRNIVASYMVWLMATRTAKLLPHLWHQPEHIIYVPAFILFGYYFAIMKIYALFTLHETAWGTRAGIGDPSAATAAAAAAAKDGLSSAEKGGVIETPSHSHRGYQQPTVEMRTAYGDQIAR